MRRDWDARIQEIDQLTPPSQVKADATSAERTRLENQLTALESKKNKLEEALKPAQESSSTETEKEDSAVDEEEFNPEDDANIDEETAPEETEESAEELAKRVASQWIPGSGVNTDPDNSYEVEEGVDDTEGTEDETENEPGAVNDQSVDELTPDEQAAEEEALKDINLGLMGGIKAWAARILAELRGKEGSEAELEHLRVAVDAFRKRVDAARAAATKAMDYVTDLNNEKMLLNEKIGRTYGPDDVYAQLAEKCIETKADKYTYKVCPYQKSEQVEHHAGTSLGSWKGFDDSGDHMKFGDGDYCWQGPHRSMTVRIKCGSTEVLTKITEPSRCEYAAEMTTPAACSEEGVAALKAGVEAKRALLDAVKDEL